MKRSSPGTALGFHRFLLGHGLVFSCAESCTGGLLARETTARSGASEVFWGSVVTYSNEAKHRLLGVSRELLDVHGAVSAPVAEAMVRGVAKLSGSDIAVSITGIAGPGGGSEAKPVGTVWFGLAARRGQWALVSVRVHLTGNRGQIQRRAARTARLLATAWWESEMDLDSLRSVVDNDLEAVVEAVQPSLLSPSDFL